MGTQMLHGLFVRGTRLSDADAAARGRSASAHAVRAWASVSGASRSSGLISVFALTHRCRTHAMRGVVFRGGYVERKLNFVARVFKTPPCARHDRVCAVASITDLEKIVCVRNITYWRYCSGGAGDTVSRSHSQQSRLLNFGLPTRSSRASNPCRSSTGPLFKRPTAGGSAHRQRTAMLFW